MPKFARPARWLPVVVGVSAALALTSPGAAVAGGCSQVSHTTTFGGYNRDTLNYSTSSATVYGTFWGTGPDDSYEAVIRITIKPNGSSSWGWYYIYEV